jgi:hypothetical protein
MREERKRNYAEGTKAKGKENSVVQRGGADRTIGRLE